MHAETLDKIIEATGKLKRLVPSKQIAALKGKFLPVLETKASESKAEIKKAFSVAYNIYSSLHDGIGSGDVGDKEFAEAIQEMQKLRSKVHQAETAKTKVKPSLEEIAVNDSISDSGEGRNGHLQTRGTEVVRKYMKFEALVPKRLPKNFAAIRCPVVGVTDPIMWQPRLAQFKLCDDTLFGYPIIKNQVLVGMNLDYIASEFKRQWKPAIEHIIEVLEEQTKTKYMQLGVGKSRGNVMWVWVVSERDMRYLNQAAGGGHFRVTGWDFPFEVDPNTHTRSPSTVKELRKSKA
jgi:hypothetical protein